jgi:transposase
MLAITANTKAYLYLADVDFRKGIDGLQAICRNMIEQDPFSGTIFIFKNRQGTSIRTLAYDGQGFWICTKRLSKGTFLWWPRSSDSKGVTLRACDLQTLLWNGNPQQAKFSKEWKKIA